MALEIKGLKRVFKFNNDTLTDPDPAMSIEEITKFYSGKYPELTTCSVTGPIIEEDCVIYEFKQNAGTKG
jgi:PRTRC genetic system protein C